VAAGEATGDGATGAVVEQQQLDAMGMTSTLGPCNAPSQLLGIRGTDFYE
jgi:hypothetical protein